jgi:predicted nucleic acid-binding protein
MIVVDTSVWIAARRQSLLAEALDALVKADEVALALPVRLELLAGVPKHERARFYRSFGALAQLRPTDDTWRQLSSWVEHAADAGQHFSIGDLLIAAMTAEIGGLVWSLDKDFERMERLKFVSVYSMPH